MSAIHVLPKTLANQIAAGEVVERPASVVKELVENSLDAGARNISVEIRRGGITFIRVTDDGYGMTPEDAKLAFLRHATSKISEVEDLNAIHTYGFRGEALAAISSVSRVELITMTDSARTGFLLSLEAGNILEEDEVGAPTGTTIIVRDLFFNTPARLAFMKKDSTEAAAVTTMMQHLAIGRYDVSFTLISDGKTVFQTVQSDSMKNAIHAVYGDDVSKNLLPIKFSYNEIKLYGYAGRPIMTRASRNMQLVFLNGRFIKSQLAYKGIDNAYRSVRETGKHPVCFVNLQMPPSMADVNVHPAKLEVKFLEEGKLITAMKYGLMDALEREFPIYVSTENGLRPAAELLGIPGGVIDPEMNDVATVAEKLLFPPIKPLSDIDLLDDEPDKNDSSGLFEAGFTAADDAAVLHSTRRETGKQETYEIDAPMRQAEQPAVPLPAGMRIIGEIFTVYCVVEYKDRVYLIDKHAAHEKMLYNRLVAEFQAAGRLPSQTLLTPVSIALSAADVDLVLLQRPVFNLAGFDLHEGDDNHIEITAVPMMLAGESFQDAFFDILKMIQDKKTESITDRQDKLFKTIACRSAIKGGTASRPEEMVPILIELVEQTDVSYCPHGRPVVVSRSKKEIDRLFKRIK